MLPGRGRARTSRGLAVACAACGRGAWMRGAQVVAGTVRSHAPLKDVGILKRLRQCATADMPAAAADEADPMQHLGCEANEPEARVGAAAPETSAKTQRDNRLWRLMRLRLDRQTHVAVRALWPEPTWPAALAAGGFTADQHIRVWLSKPDKPREQTKLHVHIEDLEPLLRMMHAERQAHGVHANRSPHGTKCAAAKACHECSAGPWHIKAGHAVVSRQVPRSRSDGHSGAATDCEAVPEQTLVEPRQSVGVSS